MNNYYVFRFDKIFRFTVIPQQCICVIYSTLYILYLYNTQNSVAVLPIYNIIYAYIAIFFGRYIDLDETKKLQCTKHTHNNNVRSL